MRRTFVGALLVLHGLAHAGAGIWAAGRSPAWLVTTLWAAAMLGFMGAGLGILRVPFLSRHWFGMVLAAAASSLVLLSIVRHEAMIAGVVLDVALAALALRSEAASPAFRGGRDEASPARSRHPVVARLGQLAAWSLLAYVGLLLTLRPLLMTWGSTGTERRTELPGDWLVPEARYRIDHAITIQASADAVWPWLAQMGQDRGGFYSYDWLENLVGADIHNADRVVPGWQHREVGDLIRAVPADWMGGRLGPEVGWRIAQIDSGHAIVLEGWGAFVLHPVDERTTRLIIRTRGDGTPSIGATLLAPLGLLVFEPAHFIMERRMLLGIKERAERHATRRLSGGSLLRWLA